MTDPRRQQRRRRGSRAPATPVRQLANKCEIDRQRARAGESIASSNELVGASSVIDHAPSYQSLETAGDREDDQDQDDQARRAEARCTEPAVPETTTKKRDEEQNDK